MPGSVYAALEWRAVPSGGAMTTGIGDAVLLRELEVTLVVRRHAHDGARAVGRQHVVADVDRHALAVVGVGAVGADEDARLLGPSTR